MAKARRTQELWGRLVEGFRQAPGNASAAGRFAGVDRKTARNAWENGWKERPWARPIKDILADERQTAMARAAELERKRHEAALADQEAARKESIEAAKQEALMLRAGRADVLGILANANNLAPTMRALGDIVRAAVLDEHGRPLPNPDISPREAMKLIERHASVTSKAIDAAEKLIERGRVERGEPGQIIGITPTKELDFVEAGEELEAAVEMLVGLVSRGAIVPSPTLRGTVQRLLSLLEPEPVSGPRAFVSAPPALLPGTSTPVEIIVDVEPVADDAPWPGFFPASDSTLDAEGER